MTNEQPRAMRRSSAAVVALIVGLPVSLAWADAAALARARQFYNVGDYESAIVAAQAAREDPEVADAAGIVLARAYLERFRREADRQDLEAARATLRQVQTARLTPRDRIDHVVGLAEALYLEDAYGAAAEMFAPLLSATDVLSPGTRERVVDWWASALDAEARTRPADERTPIYLRIIDVMEAELRRDPASGVASYWLAAAALGAGDPMRAWQAAVAGWIRAPLAPDGGLAIRRDLDRLVTDTIVADRVRDLSPPPTDPDQTAAALREEWAAVKQRWD
jgi:hypothetical protein